MFKNFVIITDKTFLMLLALMQNFNYGKGCGEINKLSSPVPSGLGFFFTSALSNGFNSKALKSKSSPHCAFMFHGCITSSDMKYLL